MVILYIILHTLIIQTEYLWSYYTTYTCTSRISEGHIILHILDTNRISDGHIILHTLVQTEHLMVILYYIHLYK